MKTYIGNYDGTRQGLVRAKNQKEAAEIAGSSLYAFRQYWNVWDGETPWYIKERVLYTKLFSSTGDWIEGRCRDTKRFCFWKYKNGHGGEWETSCGQCYNANDFGCSTISRCPSCKKIAKTD